MAAGNVAQRVCGVPVFLESGCWKSERSVGERLKVGLPSGGSVLQCRLRARAREVVVRESSKAGGVTTDEMQVENRVPESRNGVCTMPTFPSVSNSPVNEHIGYGVLHEENVYRERFVVRFSEVGDRGTMSLEMISTLLQVPFLLQKRFHWLRELWWFEKRIGVFSCLSFFE